MSGTNGHGSAVEDRLQSIDNKLERVKSDTNNINRILTLTNSPVIIQELRKAISGSKVRAAILMLTKDEISAGDLAERLGIKPENLSRDMKPFLGNKGYVTVTEVSTKRMYQRSQLVDLIGYESIPEFAELLKQWEASRTRQAAIPPSATTVVPAQEQTNVF